MSPLTNPTEFTLYAFYIVCMMAQIYLQCYYGSLAATESEKTLFALFSGNWLDVNVKNRKFLIMFMARLKEPCRIRTMKVFLVDRRTFTSVKWEI